MIHLTLTHLTQCMTVPQATGIWQAKTSLGELPRHKDFAIVAPIDNGKQQIT